MSSPIESALEALNLAFKTDPGAIAHVLRANSVCTSAIEDHPTIPVDDEGHLTGLGLLNGLLRAATGHVINAHYKDTGHLVGFSIAQELQPVPDRKLLAIPVLVYVEPGPDNPLTNEDFEARIVSALALVPGVYEVFIAEDYETTDYVEPPDEDLTAMIAAACSPID